MAANTFDEMVRSLRLYVPHLPYMLAQQFIRDRYRRILERRTWAGLRGEGEFVLSAYNTTGTVTVTRNSAAVTGSGTSFASTDVGRQFKVGSSAVYTIATYVSSTSITLDRVWGTDTASGQTFTLFDGYVTAPSDFKSFIAVMDHAQAYRLRFWVTQDELNAWDPQRNNFGQPFVLADRRYSSNVPTFEAWPYTSANRSLHYLYFKLGSDLAQDSDQPIYPIRSDAIVSGALADVCRWPGTPDRPNPMFGRMDIWKSYELEFEDKMIEIERADENIYMTWLAAQSFNDLPYADTNYLFSHGL